MGGNYEYMVMRSFFYFDLANFSTSGRTIQDVKVTFKNRDYRDSNVSIVEGTQSTPLSVDDFDAIGSTELATRLSWAVADEYIANWKTFVLNSTGKTYISNKAGDVAKFCLRESNYDFDNATPSTEKRNGLYFSEENYPDLVWSPYHYYPSRPYLEIEYMKVPVWSVKLDQVYWEPWNEDSDSAVWNGTGWEAGTYGSVDIQVKTGTTWANNYKPLKMKVTFTGASGPVTLALFGTKNSSFYPYDPWEYGDVESGQEVTLDWYWPDDNIFELYIDADVVITNIEFLER